MGIFPWTKEFASMAMQQDPKMEVPTIDERPIFQAYVSKYPRKYGLIWY